MVKPYYRAKNYQARKSIGHLIRRASNLITPQIEALFVSRDISFVQYVVLMSLRDGLAICSTEICRNLRYDSGAFTRIIDQLEERKLITRKRCTDDRRVVKLKLTPLGRKTVESFIPRLVDYYNALLTDFSHHDAEMLVHLLTKLNTQLSKPGGLPCGS